MSKDNWLKEQLELASKEVLKWDEWKRRAMFFESAYPVAKLTAVQGGKK